MKLAVISNEVLKRELLHKGVPQAIELVIINDAGAVPADADIIVDLLFKNEAGRIETLKKFLPRR